MDSLVDAFGPLPVAGTDRTDLVPTAVRWIAGRIGEPGVGAAFAGVFTDAVNDSALRAVLRTRLQDPYRLTLQELLGLPSEQVLLYVDVVGTLLRRLGMTGSPMVDADVEALLDMVQARLAHG